MELWIELPLPENLANTHAEHTETLDSCFNLIRSYQQYIPWSPPLEIEPVTTDCRAKTLQLNNQFISHMPNQLVTVIAQPINLNVSRKLHLYSLQRTRSPPGPCLPKRIRNTYLCNYYDLKGKDIGQNSYPVFLYVVLVFARFSGRGNSIHNIIPLLKKENVHLFRIGFTYNHFNPTKIFVWGYSKWWQIK